MPEIAKFAQEKGTNFNERFQVPVKDEDEQHKCKETCKSSAEKTEAVIDVGLAVYLEASAFIITANHESGSKLISTEDMSNI